jgi:hypothetical protein
MRKVLALLLLAACGDDGPSMKLDEFLVARHHAECTRLTRCGLFTSESICNAYFRYTSEAPLVEAVARKKIGYDGGAAIACVDALAAISCDKTQRDARTEPAACANVFTARVADGAACSFAAECKSGICDAPACTRDKCCPGTCAPTISAAAAGAACTIDAQCAAGYCNKQNVCAARPREGAACDEIDACDFGLACIGVTDQQAGNCRKLPATGEQCPYRQCAEIAATCTSSFTCAALGLPGAACTQDADCSPFAVCDEAAGTCKDTPTLGMACDLYCAGEAWCQAGVCVAPYADGTACDADIECASTDCFEGTAFDQCNPVAVCI